MTKKRRMPINLQTKDNIVVGIISDTHGLLLPTAIFYLPFGNAEDMGHLSQRRASLDFCSIEVILMALK